MAYCDLDDLKRYKSVGSTGEDELLGELIVAAQAAIDAMLRRTFEAAADTVRKFDPTCDVTGRTLFLDRDLCQITTITNGDGIAVTSGQYVKEPRNETPWYALTLKSTSNVSWTYTTDPEDSISITGRWAYSITAPALIRQVCIELAAYYYDKKDSLPESDRAQVGDGGIMLLPAKVPEFIWTKARHLKRHVG